MDIKLITRHAPVNYGSLLQTAATVWAIRRLGHDCAVIDYRRDDERGLGMIKSTLSTKARWNSNIFRRAAYIAMRYPLEKAGEISFGRFRKAMLPLTERYSSYDTLATLSADIFMTGSDQVWGPVANGICYDPAYFLDFATKGKKVAYAASFGHSQLDETTRQAMRRMLSSYARVTVREDTGAKIIEDMNLPAAPQVLDPTLLPDATEWTSIAGIEPGGVERPYILVYQIHNNPDLNVYARRIARMTGKKLVRVSPSPHQFNRGGKFVCLPSPGRFLGLIKEADLMITDSFHGTAFAINFNTQFIEFLPDNGTAGRNLSLLRMTGLTDRVVTDPMNDSSTHQKAIDFGPVNEIIDKNRQRSFDILQQMLK